MNERIKKLRQALGLSQDEFGRRLGVTRGAVTNIELNKVEPKPLFVDLICREFNVSEEWLRTGAGEMFQPKSRNEELFEFAAKVAEGDPGSIQAQLLAVMSRLTDEQWEVLAQVAREFAEETKKTGPPIRGRFRGAI